MTTESMMVRVKLAPMGLAPRIHVFVPGPDVDGRDKPGHDEAVWISQI